MATETVDVYVQDDQVTPQPVNGIVVRVYDATGTTLITSGTTGSPASDGHVEFSLPGDNPAIVYQLRFYISGGSIPSPQLIEVYSPPSAAPTSTNNFQVDATIFTLPTASDPLLCRCSGYVVTPEGQPRKGVDIHLIPCFNPLVAGDKGVLSERVATSSDSDGYVQLDLYRNGKYLATVESQENVERQVTVPDRSSININHLLFPIVVSATFDPAGPWTMSVGDTLEITPTITASNYQVLDGAAADDLIYEIDDTAVATVSVSNDTIVITAVAAGSATLTLSRADDSIVYIPDPGIDGGTVAITVV